METHPSVRSEQRILLAVWPALIVLMGLFLPWLYRVDCRQNTRSARADISAGYHFIAFPPSLPSSRPDVEAAVPSVGDLVSVSVMSVCEMSIFFSR